MRIAIIGGGMAGLGAAYELCKRGFKDVTIYERSESLGGLASGIVVGGQSLETYYHHMYPTYYDFFETAEDLGIRDKIFFKRAKTGIYYNGKSYPFDSPLDLMRFSPLGLGERLRAGAGLALLRYITSYKPYEGERAIEWLPRVLGRRAYEILWEPLLFSKFGGYAKEVGMAWFWGKIRERPSKFGYFNGGFQTFINALEAYLIRQGVCIRKDCGVQDVREEAGKFIIRSKSGEDLYERLITAAPPQAFIKLTRKMLPDDYIKSLEELRYVGTVCSILVLKQSVVPYYWLNVNDPGSPFLGVIEHTQFVPRSNYQGFHIAYLAKYLNTDNPFYRATDEEIWACYLGYLKKINSEFSENWIEKRYIFRAPFAQPVITPDYGRRRPGYATPKPGLFWVSMSHIYPWDRGTDHSFHEGRQLVRECIKS